MGADTEMHGNAPAPAPCAPMCDIEKFLTDEAKAREEHALRSLAPLLKVSQPEHADEAQRDIRSRRHAVSRIRVFSVHEISEQILSSWASSTCGPEICRSGDATLFV